MEFKVWDRVKICDIARLKLAENTDEWPWVDYEMYHYCWKITTIKENRWYNQYKLYCDDWDYIRYWPWLTLLPKKQPTLIKKWNCFCGNKQVPLMNIQETYICKKCVDTLFKSYKPKPWRKS